MRQGHLRHLKTLTFSGIREKKKKKSLNLIGCHGNIKGKFSKKYSKISSEAVRGMKLKLCIYVHDISLYIYCVFYCRCPCAFVAMELIMGKEEMGRYSDKNFTEMFLD